MLRGLLLTLLMQPAAAPATWQDRETLVRQAREKLRDGDVEARLAALKELALLGLDDEGEPDRAVAESIARGVSDPVEEVRAEAIRLLLAGQHREVALQTLVGVLDDIQRELAKIGRKSGADEPVDPAAVRRRRLSMFQVIDGLGTLPDDRSVKALIDFMAALPKAEQAYLFVRVSAALLELGSRDGVEAAIQRLGELEARGASGKVEKQAQQLHELLRTSAASRGLAGTPDAGPQVAAEWRRWYSQNQKHYAARLGKISPRPDDDEHPQPGSNP